MLNTIGILKIFEDYLEDFQHERFILSFQDEKLIIKQSEKGIFKYQLFKYLKEELKQFNNLALNFKITESNDFIIYPIPKYKYIHKQQTILTIF